MRRTARGPGVAAHGTSRGGVALLSSAHVVNDLYQGAVPAMLPFLALAHGYSHAAVAGLTLAATVLSSVAQPVLGWWADVRDRPWMVWVGTLVAAAGIAVAGVAGQYLVVWVALAVSGLGIAAFHPEAARVARFAAGDSSGAMGLFALGGNLGYAVGTGVAALVIGAIGLQGTPVLLVPAVAMALLLARRLPRIVTAHHARSMDAGSRTPPARANDWRSFSLLTAAVVVRSIVFLGVTTFLALYTIQRFGLSPEAGAAAVTVFLASGAAGTLLGGLLGDRWSRLAIFRLGFVLGIPALAGIVFAPNAIVAFVSAAAAGVALYLPFAVMVILGQDYLPRNMGIASGVTVGLSMTVGGLASPVIGWIADVSSLQLALSVLIVLPVLALALSAPLRRPGAARPGTSRARAGSRRAPRASPRARRRV